MGFCAESELELESDIELLELKSELESDTE